MQLSSTQAGAVREQLATCLEIDISRVVPEANFFHDLGGTSEHLRPLRLAIERALGVSIEPIVDGLNAMTQVGADGNLTLASLGQIRAFLGEWPHAPSLPAPFPSLFTVAMIEAVVAKAFEPPTAQSTAEPAEAGKLSPEDSTKVRKSIARRCRVPVEQLAPETHILRELHQDGDGLGVLLALLGAEMDVKLAPALGQIISNFQVGANGCLTPTSLEKLRQSLPGIELSAARPAEIDDLWTVAVLEAMVAKAMAARPAGYSSDAIWHWQHQDWLRRLPQELGPRKLRLLLAGCCRNAFEPRGQQYGIEREVDHALQTLERFADTGKTKKALREAQVVLEQWRLNRIPALYALHKSLSPTDPAEALVPACSAMGDEHKISKGEALERFRAYCRDLASLPADSAEFVSAWRTPAVVDLARSMYESHDFGAMPRLAERLEQAGCRDPAVLNHCRDPQSLHIRGCWVIDAILDGSWANVHKTLKREKAKKALLSRLSKRVQCKLAQIMDERDGHLPLEQFLAQCWDLEGFWKSRGRSDDDVAKRVAAGCSQFAQMFPAWSDDQLRTALSFSQLTINLKEAAVAHRPRANSAGSSRTKRRVENRLGWMLSFLTSPPNTAFSELLDACAVRDLTVAQRLVQGEPYRNREAPNDFDLCSLAMDAVLLQDLDALGSLTGEMAKRKVRPWMQGIYACFNGIAADQPQQVAEGLTGLLDGLRRLRDKDDLSDAINLLAHGLHRLCEWVSSDLVAGFDVTQPLPWDAEFHAWCQNHPDPLQGVDLSSISPVMQEAVVLLKPPAWWIAPPKPEGSPKDVCEVVLTSPGPKLAEVIQAVRQLAGGSVMDAKRLIDSCPVVIRSGIYRGFANNFKQLLEAAGSSVEIRVLARQ